MPLASGFENLFGVLFFLIVAILSALGKRGKAQDTGADPLEEWTEVMKREQEAKQASQRTPSIPPLPPPTRTVFSQGPAPVYHRTITIQRRTYQPPPLPLKTQPQAYHRAPALTTHAMPEASPFAPRATEDRSARQEPLGEGGLSLKPQAFRPPLFPIQEPAGSFPVPVEKEPLSVPEAPKYESVHETAVRVMLESQVKSPLVSAEAKIEAPVPLDLSMLRSPAGLKRAMVLREILGEPKALSGFPA